VLSSLTTLRPYLDDSRFTKKADFYGLFAAAAAINKGSKTVIDLSSTEKALKALERALEKPAATLTGTAARYYSTVIEGPNKRSKREERTEILHAILAR
jgi:hypothetical protein